jgi:uncharacterized membrane protein (DUF4010 family)
MRESPDVFALAVHWPYAQVLSRLALALALGFFVGLEREWRGKEAGVRTFTLSALMGCLSGLAGDNFALLSLVLLGVLVCFLNWQRLQTQQTTELTTSVALLVTGFIGILCSKGHTFTPVVAGVVVAGLLSWKEKLTTFALGLSAVELRSAILLAILSFVIYLVLPAHPVDPWGLLEPQATWATIILIAGLGFVNYILWKLYGTRGIELTGFLGGLVNSTVAVTELATRVREQGEGLIGVAYRGVVLSTVAMLLRNGVILGSIAPQALKATVLPLGLMIAVGAGLALLRRPSNTHNAALSQMKMDSPFSLQAALKFGVIFLALKVVGTLSQRALGTAGFYAVSLIGGTISSASSVASAATLASHGNINATVAGTGALLASFTSVAINLPLIARISQQRRLTLEVAFSLGAMVLAGVIGTFVQMTFVHSCKRSLMPVGTVQKLAHLLQWSLKNQRSLLQYRIGL